MIKETLNSNLLSKKYLSMITNHKILEQPIESISTGNLQLDAIMGCNGIPKKRITEIYGGESSGKTTLALQTAKEVTKQQKNVLYIDLEYSLDINYVKQIGIDTNYFYVAHPKNGVDAFDLIDDALNAKSFALIIADSVAAMLPEEELENKMVDTNALGAHARLMSRGIRKIQLSLFNSNTALIFINQIREKIGILFGNPETTTGGKALKYYATIRMELKKSELIKDGNNKIGIKTKITLIKNKIGNPYASTFINIYFGQGFNYTNDILEYAIEKEIIKKSGAWYSYDNKNIGQGWEQLKSYALNNPKWLDKIKNLCINFINAPDVNTKNH